MLLCTNNKLDIVVREDIDKHTWAKRHGGKQNNFICITLLMKYNQLFC